MKMILMYNIIYDCIKMYVFNVNNIDLEEIFYCKIFIYLFNIYFYFFLLMVLNLFGFSLFLIRIKVKLIYI